MRKGKYLFSDYIFYKWNDTDTIDSVLDKCHDGEDTIHTEVLFYDNMIILQKTDCKIFDANKHTLRMSYKDFTDMMNIKDKIEGELYDWVILEQNKNSLLHWESA